MALTILIRTQMDAIPELTPVCFTKDWSGATSTTITTDTPRGVLGGTVAALSPGNNYKVVPGSTALMPVGLFVNDAAGAAFENSPAVASNKVTIIKGQASVEVDVYETESLNNGGYTVGDRLYSSDDGLLTNVPTAHPFTTLIGIVTKVPTAQSPTLGLDMRI